MSEQELIQSKLTAVARRLQWVAVLKLMAQVAFWTCIALLVFFGAYKLLPMPFESVEIAFIAGGVVIVGACVFAFLRRVSLSSAARFADQKLSLKERLSSAIEITSDSALSTQHSALSALLLRDAAKHAETLDPRKILPLHLPVVARWVLVCLVAIVGLAFVPEYRTAEYKERQRAKQDVKKEGEKLVSLVKRIEQNTRQAQLGDLQKELKALNELGQEFQKVSLTKEQSLRDINTVADKIRKKQEELGDNKSLRSLEKRAAASGTEPNAQQREQMQQKINDMEKKLGSNPPTPEQLEKTKQDLKQALDKLKSSPNPNTPDGKAAKEAMEKSIEAAMEQAKNSADMSDALEKALEGLKSADVDMITKGITDAVKDLDEMKQQTAALNKMKQDAKQAGKDLAEQLEKGQGQAAKQTLEKFIKQVQQSNLSDKQKEEIAKELTKALDPAKDFGKVGEHLQDAVSQLAKNDKPGAANSMQAAAEELQKLMDQQGEGQSLAEMMDALKKSQCQIATGNCQGSQCKNGTCNSGTPKGKGNRGFGDWPDENNTQTPEYSETWDNSGLSRGEKDSKGVTDRGDPKITDKVTPTKLHGKMQNAGPMPGITLKGVSIKGQSNVEMEQSTTAAKQEAEDALNKEQIPKSYQGQVKEYFDSLK
ncbi:MAG: hypothetical protein EXS18_07335 [Verrucomicrobiae bacterium]|nr:hypothetical protein [Verrucomicrobiae bacterium]